MSITIIAVPTAQTTMQNTNESRVTPVMLKTAIIGKAWVNTTTSAIIPANYVLPVDMTFRENESYLIGNLSFRTDRNLTIPVTVKAGEKLFFFANTKRAGFQDPDYSVSVLLPEAEALAVIENNKAGVLAWKQENQVA